MSVLKQQERTPIEVIHEFVTGVDDGTIRRDLADDCVLSFYRRTVRGPAAVTGFLRTRVTNHYKHENFEEAAPPSLGQEIILRERFATVFERSRRRLYKQNEEEKSTALHLHPDSDDEEVPATHTVLLTTPPRPSSYALDTIKYVEAIGMLNRRERFVYGGVDLGESSTVHLTLGYRRHRLSGSGVQYIEICLAVYDRGSISRNQHTQATTSIPFPRRDSARCNTTTDDEAEEAGPLPTRRGVCRTLFTEENDTEEEQEQFPQVGAGETPQDEANSPVGPLPSVVIPICSRYPLRKRHQTTNDNETTSKRTPGQSRLRF
ncbi:cell cycle negative regulator roughex [Drosophila ficusphila]|uniref:cell cycle negative regulator roughex n=1 Tax=Drosophila ficusphila TaxID=30025 RepID=UPI0007E72A2F|nr:cell cycle negative regulator roughex [Drosophila ficusphila]